MNQVRAFLAANALALVAAAALVVAGAFGGLLLGSFLGGRSGLTTGLATATPTPTLAPALAPDPTTEQPSTPAPTATVTPSPTPSPTPTPTLVPAGSAGGDGTISISGGDPVVVAAIQASADRLHALDRFRFASGVSGRSLDDLRSDPLFDIAMRGSLVRSPELAFDVVLQSSLVEPGGVASVTSSTRVVLIGHTAWAPQPSQTPRPETVDDESLDRVLSFLPDGIVDRAIVPFAAGYAVVGPESKSGVDAVHYRANEAGLRAYREVVGVTGACAADVWIAASGGHPVAAKITCDPPNPTTSETRGFYAEFEITDAGNEEIRVDPPA